MVPHLKKLLELLKGLPTHGPEEVERLIRTISLDRSSGRVESLKAELEKRIREALDDILDKEGRAILLDLRAQLIDDQELPSPCDRAYTILKTKLGRDLCQRKLDEPIPGPWTEVRHYVGRLRAWHIAAKAVVRGALHSPELLTVASVEAVRDQSSPRYNFPPGGLKTGEPSLDSILHELCGNHALDGAKPSLCMACGLTIEELGGRFVDIYNKRPRKYRVHAEVMMADHFLARQLRFVNDDRYIGCSKPSCYCCGLYLHVHPLQLEARPCHSRVWMKWCWPSLPKRHTEHEARQWAKIRSDFNLRIAQDIRDSITSRTLVPRGRPHNSSTGISDYLTNMSLSRNAEQS